jgi:hypothetical protein
MRERGAVAPMTRLLDKLRQASNYLRKLRLSLGPDSYFQYKRRRNYARKQADHAREHVGDSADREREEAEHEREKAARERDYEERYAREREGDAAPKRAGEVEPDP